MIADFGLSTTFDGRTWRGTAPFIAPEIFDALYISRRQRHPLTPTIDEWGAGLVGLDALFSGTLWKMQLGRVEPVSSCKDLRSSRSLSP